MRQILSRPWVARIVCGVLFLAAMAAVRIALIALRDTRDLDLAAAICIPGMVVMLAIGLWIDRKGY